MLALWHITFVEKGLQAVLRPKTPDYSAPGENVEINRISLAPTINECIKGLGNENDFNTKERKIYAYKILVEEGDESLYDSNYLSEIDEQVTMMSLKKLRDDLNFMMQEYKEKSMNIAAMHTQNFIKKLDAIIKPENEDLQTGQVIQ